MFKHRSITAVAVTVLAVSCAPPAHADSAQDLAEKYGISVCRSLDADPTIVFLAVILGGLGLGGWAMWECWKTAHRPGYQSPLVHGWED